MKYYELDKQEKEILDNYEKDDFKSVLSEDAKNKYQEYVKNTVKKAKNINIRLSERDLQKVKAKAIKKGIPYQTLLASIIHQYADGQINDV